MDTSLTPLQILQANSLPSLVQSEIEQMILRGELVGGQRINEVELAERFKTSRSPVREALRALEDCGLVRSERNRGSFVREVTLAEADEAYDVREALDELIGRRLAERISETAAVPG
jgi:DNA-binding GntR family transcriptional regulator